MTIHRLAPLAALACLIMAGCAAPPPSRQASANNADRAACRQRADEIYNKQNRADTYRADSFTTSSLDSPYASTGLPGVPSAGLSSAFARDNLVSDCLNNRPGFTGGTEAPANGGLNAP